MLHKSIELIENRWKLNKDEDFVHLFSLVLSSGRCVRCATEQFNSVIVSNSFGTPVALFTSQPHCDAASERCNCCSQCVSFAIVTVGGPGEGITKECPKLI